MLSKNKDNKKKKKKEIETHLNSGDDVILEIDIEGALKIKEKYPETLFIFILPPSRDRLIDRLIKRGTESKEKIVKRFRKAYKEINEVTKYNYVVVNDNLEKAVNKVNIDMLTICKHGGLFLLINLNITSIKNKQPYINKTILKILKSNKLSKLVFVMQEPNKNKKHI